VAAATVDAGRAVRFSTAAVEGFVVNQGGQYRAFSATCTHLGCLLQESDDGRFVCPCHRTAFGLDGSVLEHQLLRPPAPLPWLHTRVRDGQVEVLTV
jgi:nitrite reductase/ring-hydroxylating ferredoxin subunit